MNLWNMLVDLHRFDLVEIDFKNGLYFKKDEVHDSETASIQFFEATIQATAYYRDGEIASTSSAIYLGDIHTPVHGRVYRKIFRMFKNRYLSRIKKEKRKERKRVKFRIKQIKKMFKSKI